MKFDEFSAANLRRCESPLGFNHDIGAWSMSDWITATLGELGEAANIVKKLNRYRDDIAGNAESEQELLVKLADEIADTFIYLDLFATYLNVDLESIVKDKWNRSSQKLGYAERL